MVTIKTLTPMSLPDEGVVIGGDTRLIRTAANELSIDDALGIYGNLSLNIKGDATLWGGLSFGDPAGAVMDAYVHRSTTDTLEIDTLGAGPVKCLVQGVLGYTNVLRAGGTSFPAGAVAGDRYFRTDLDLEFVYDGTRWLSTQLFAIDGHLQTVFQGLAATNAAFMRVGTTQAVGTDLWIEKVITTFTVNAGTALGAAHHWDLTVSKASVAAALTTIATAAINSGASATWRSDTQTVNALLGTSAAFPVLQVGWAKTGTPGSLISAVRVTYRIVQT